MSTNNIKSHYLIKLEPLDKFFFGGEKSLNKEKQTFYYQVSRDFPQQTSLLGMVRFAILEKGGFIEYRPTGSKKIDLPKLEEYENTNNISLVGNQSFSDKNSNFGVIEQVSPVFILDKGLKVYHQWHRIKYYANEDDKNKNKFSFANPDFIQSPGRFSLNGIQINQKLQVLQNYDPKHGFESSFKSLDDSLLGHDTVFETVEEKIGINKIRKDRKNIKETEQESFFKTDFKKLKTGFAFGFYLTLSSPADIFEDNYESIVFIGGEKSCFKMTIIKRQDAYKYINKATPPQTTLLCVSDAYIERTTLDKCQAGIINSITFRHFKTNTSTENYAKKPDQSAKLNLVEKGSILIFKEPPTFEDLVPNNHFFKIGYNHFINL